MCVILSSVIKTHAILFYSAHDMNDPFVQHTHVVHINPPVSYLVAILVIGLTIMVSQGLYSSNWYFTY